jgi:hypothetical protein
MGHGRDRRADPAREPGRWPYPLVGRVPGETKILRVVTLDDGETIHNAFFDRNFREEQG